MAGAGEGINPADGTITVYSDVGCPWATVALAGLRRAADRTGRQLRIDHRAFALELINSRPTPRRTVDGELAALRAVEPRLTPWRGRDSEYPVTTLLALEAVQAAKRTGGLVASDQLDAALRRAFYAEGRCISILPVVLDVASGCPDLDVAALTDALHSGVGRAEVLAQTIAARDGAFTGGEVNGSPHVFAPDGRSWHNPGISAHWTDGRPVVESRDPAVLHEIVAAAAAALPVGSR
jgi:predicted DsbA family dithiol-disulfide isomerase